MKRLPRFDVPPPINVRTYEGQTRTTMKRNLNKRTTDERNQSMKKKYSTFDSQT